VTLDFRELKWLMVNVAGGRKVREGYLALLTILTPGAPAGRRASDFFRGSEGKGRKFSIIRIVLKKGKGE